MFAIVLSLYGEALCNSLPFRKAALQQGSRLMNGFVDDVGLV